MLDFEDAKGVVHEEFVQWFGSDTAGAPERYQRVAKRVWEEVVPELMSFLVIGSPME